MQDPDSSHLRGATVPPTSLSKGDALLERGSSLVTRLGQVHSKLSTVLQRVGLSCPSAPQGEHEEGFGYLGRMDMTLCILYDILDDIDKQLETLEQAF